MKDTPPPARAPRCDLSVVEALRAYVRAHAEALRTRGVTSLALFGSFARGEGGPESDVDVLYAFAAGRSSIDTVLDLQEAIEAATGRSVHLVSRRHLHPLLGTRVLDEAVVLFEAEAGQTVE